MPRSLQGYLWDIVEAADNILNFTHGKQLSDYQRDAMLRFAVERNFEVIGEALAQALRFFPKISGRISNAQEVIAFRNRLIHGYANVRHALVWDIVESELPMLRREAVELLREAEEQQN
jgi:uncharacterized protein with HEPN domain